MKYELLNFIELKLRTVDIYDNVSTSTWNKFLSYMNILGDREIGTSMVKVSILNVRPDPAMVFWRSNNEYRYYPCDCI